MVAEKTSQQTLQPLLVSCLGALEETVNTTALSIDPIDVSRARSRGTVEDDSEGRCRPHLLDIA